MAAVSLTIDENFPPTADIADSLLGGGSGWQIGSCTTGQWAPITNKLSNLGHQDLYIKHDGANKITNFAVSVAAYGTATGATYGGSDTANNDYTNVIAQGNNSGTSKNSSDGASNGLWIEMQWDVSDANRFDRGARSTLVKAFGDSGNGISVPTAYTLAAETMVYDSSGETAASAAVAGELGESTNTVLGDVCHTQWRHYARQTGAEINGTVQYEIIFSYAFTS